MKAGSLSQDARQISYSEGSLELVAHHASGGQIRLIIAVVGAVSRAA